MATSDSGSQVTADSSQLVKAADYPDTSPPVLISHSDKASTETYPAAMTAIFETNELLHNILLHLPVKFRARTRRVSQVWRYVVSKIGYTIDPGFKDSQAPRFYPFLFYSAYTNIRINPIFTETGYNPGGNRVFVRISCRPLYTSTLLHRQEFITAPPITTISFGFDVNDRDATLRARDGIRVGDLVDIFDKMRTQASLAPDARGQPIAWYNLCEKEGKWWRQMTG
jgi:hypothetical protein